MRLIYLLAAFAGCVPTGAESVPDVQHYQSSQICGEDDGRAIIDLGSDPRGIELRICTPTPDGKDQVCDLVQGASHTTLERLSGSWELTYPCLPGELLTAHWYTRSPY